MYVVCKIVKTIIIRINVTKISGFFRFPKNLEVCEKWMKVCGHKVINTKTARICSSHFEETDYCLKDRLLDIQVNKRKLDLAAVKTKNLPIHVSESERNKREKKENEEELFQNALNNTSK